MFEMEKKLFYNECKKQNKVLTLDELIWLSSLTNIELYQLDMEKFKEEFFELMAKTNSYVEFANEIQTLKKQTYFFKKGA